MPDALGIITLCRCTASRPVTAPAPCKCRHCTRIGKWSRSAIVWSNHTSEAPAPRIVWCRERRPPCKCRHYIHFGKWVSASACTYVCTAGACTGSCTSGTKQCITGNVPQTCTANHGLAVPLARTSAARGPVPGSARRAPNNAMARCRKPVIRRANGRVELLAKMYVVPALARGSAFPAPNNAWGWCLRRVIRPDNGRAGPLANTCAVPALARAYAHRARRSATAKCRNHAMHPAPGTVLQLALRVQRRWELYRDMRTNVEAMQQQFSANLQCFGYLGEQRYNGLHLRMHGRRMRRELHVRFRGLQWQRRADLRFDGQMGSRRQGLPVRVQQRSLHGRVRARSGSLCWHCPQTCSDLGQWQSGDACYVCNGAGSCTGVCSPGSGHCTAYPSVLRSDGQWVSQAACTNSVCQAGTCTGVCSAGAKQCVGDVPQTCM